MRLFRGSDFLNSPSTVIRSCANGFNILWAQMRPTMPVWAIDPTGSGIKNYIETGVFESSGSCYIEGIGIMRKTANFAEAKVDGAFAFCGCHDELVLMRLAIIFPSNIILGWYVSDIYNCHQWIVMTTTAMNLSPSAGKFKHHR